MRIELLCTTRISPLLFILPFNDLHKNVEFSTVYHFADATNMLLVEKITQKIKQTYIERAEIYF